VTPIGNLFDLLASCPLPHRPAYGNLPIVKPSVGRMVHYFPDDERYDIQRRTGRVWPAIITQVFDRAYDDQGTEIGPWVVSLTAFIPSTERTTGESGFPAEVPLVVGFDYVPLSGMYDREDLDAHPSWIGCWNWPPRIDE
jgi:hypothetical protein